jgi:hypothetical protein
MHPAELIDWRVALAGLVALYATVLVLVHALFAPPRPARNLPAARSSPAPRWTRSLRPR